MQITRDDGRFPLIPRGPLSQRTLVSDGGRRRIKIAQMRAEREFIPTSEGDTVLLMPADRRDDRTGKRTTQRQRGVASRSPQPHRRVAHHTYHRIVARPLDRTIMQQKGVRDAGQPLNRLRRRSADCFFTAAAARGAPPVRRNPRAGAHAAANTQASNRAADCGERRSRQSDRPSLSDATTTRPARLRTQVPRILVMKRGNTRSLGPPTQHHGQRFRLASFMLP